MPMTSDQFAERLSASGLMSAEEVSAFVQALPADSSSRTDGEALVRELVKQKKLTKFQAEQIYLGKGASLTLGNYIILDKLGQGGMGMVLKAEHKRMKRLVAIKVMSPAAVKTPDALKRFHREVEAAAKLRHTNIVAADDADEAKGTHFLVMEYVDGSDLSALVKKNGPLSVERAMSCIIQAARGLEYAHSQGVIHRDIKPANLLIDAKGTVKILDMGLARIDDSVGGSSEGAGLTSTGTIMGTVDYMSPEQAMDTKHADARSDLYSLGCSFYYLLTGRCLYDGDTIMKKLIAHREAAIPTLNSVPHAVANVFRRMVAKNPAERYATMTEVIADLQSCLISPSTTTMPEATTGATNFTDFLAMISDRTTAATTGLPAKDASATQVTRTLPQSKTAAIDSATVQWKVGDEETEPHTEVNVTQAAPRKSLGSRRSGGFPRSTIIGAATAGLLLLGLIGWVVFGGGKKSDQVASTNKSRQSNTQTKSNPTTTTTTTTDDKTGKSAVAPPNGLPVGAANDPERSVAEWVISKGGRVELRPMYQQVSQLAELPKEPFVVNAVIFTTLQELTVADVDRLATLSHLRGLSLTDTLLTVESARRIADKLSLDGFSYDTITAPPTPPPFQELLKCRSLHALTLKHPAIDDELVSRLGQLDRLTTLVLDQCPKVTSGGLIRFAGNPPPKLNVFNLGDVHVDRRMLEAIATLPHLESLSLRGGVYDDLGLAELHRCPALCQFWYAGNSTVTRAGITALQKVLGNCQMNLADPELATALYDQSYRDTVRELMRRGYLIHVRTNKSSGAWLQDEQAFPEGEVLYAANIYPKVRPGKSTNEDVKLLTKLRDLPILSIDQLPSNGLRELLPLQNLSSLNVGSPLTDEDAQLLLSFKKLNAVNVHVTSDAALESLAQLPHLSILHLMLPVDTKIQSLKPLESVATLSQLHFPLGGGATLTEADAHAFANARPDVIVYCVGKRLEPAFPRAANEPPQAITPFDPKQARAHQEAWAKHLRVPVEKEVTLPGGEKLVMMLIPPGEFSRNEENQPSFRVRITKPFYLGKYEVTQAQWQAVMGSNPSQFKDGPTNPVDQVTWDEIQPFLAKLNAGSEQETVVFGLPTEAQWEFACRAGTTGLYSFGDNVADLPQYGHYNANSYGKPQRIGKLKPNPFGLYDIHGNLWEWCVDWKIDGYYAKAPLEDPPGPLEGSERVSRGGSWFFEPHYLQSGMRGTSAPSRREPNSGFRLAASIDSVRQNKNAAIPATNEGPQYALDFNYRIQDGNARVVLPPMLRPDEPCTVEMYFTPRSVSDKWDSRMLFVNANGVQLMQQQTYMDWSGPLKPASKDNRIRVKDSVKAGKRTYLAGVSTGKELRFFVDGQLSGTIPLVGDLSRSASQCYLGSLSVNLDSFSPLDGLIDEVRISNVARYNENFKPASQFESDSSTLALYRFDEGAGDVLKDSSGNNRHGKIQGAKWIKFSDAFAWTDWLGPRLERNEIGGNGWIREGDAFSTERIVSGIGILPDTTRNGALRLTYLLRDSKGMTINARDRNTDKTDATRELYVAEEDGSRVNIVIYRGGTIAKTLASQPIPADIPKDAPRTLEFQVVGDTLTATLNGSMIVTAKDSSIPAGNFALVALKGVLIQKVEYRTLPEPK